MKYVFYLFWIFVYSRSEALRRVLGGISRNQRRFLLLLFWLVVFGQVVQMKPVFYPLTYWGMYSKIDDSGTVYEFSGVRADGSEFRLPMTDIVRTHSKRFVWRLRSLAGDIKASANTDTDGDYRAKRWSHGVQKKISPSLYRTIEPTMERVFDIVLPDTPPTPPGDLYDLALQSAWARYRDRTDAEEIVAIRVRKARVETKSFVSREELQWTLFREVPI